MLRQLHGRSAPRVATTVPMSIVVVVASCASGVALVLILIGIAGAVRCRRVRGGSHRRTSGGGGGASKRLPVNAGIDFPELSPFDAAAELDSDVGFAVTVSPTTEIADCAECKQPKQHRRGNVIMNGVKAPARSRRCSDETSVCTELVVVFFTTPAFRHRHGVCQRRTQNFPFSNFPAKKKLLIIFTSMGGWN